MDQRHADARRHHPAAADLRRGGGAPELRAHVRAAAPDAGGGVAAGQAARGASPGIALFERRGRKLAPDRGRRAAAALRAADPRRAEGRRRRDLGAEGPAPAGASASASSARRSTSRRRCSRAFQRAPPRRARHAVGQQPRGDRARARAQRDRRRDHGHAAAADRDRGGAVRRPSAGRSSRRRRTRWRARRRIPLDALADETFLVREQGSGTRSSMERLFAERGFASEDRQRDEQQRDDQAGGDGRHGARASSRATPSASSCRRAGWSSSTSPACR